MSAPLIIGFAIAALVAWRLLRAQPVAVLAVVALAVFLAQQGAPPVPDPVRDGVDAAESWREERTAALRCNVAVLAALASSDEEHAMRRLEDACDNRRERRRILDAPL